MYFSLDIHSIKWQKLIVLHLIQRTKSVNCNLKQYNPENSAFRPVNKSCLGHCYPDKVKRNGLDIKVRGLPEAIAELKTEDVKIVVDAGNKSFVNGRNEMSIRVEFPKDSGVCAIGPYLLYVDVKINK